MSISERKTLDIQHRQQAVSTKILSQKGQSLHHFEYSAQKVTPD